MKKLLPIISWLSLVAMMVGPLLYMADRMELSVVKVWMLVFTVIWFVTVPFWMDRKSEG